MLIGMGVAGLCLLALCGCGYVYSLLRWRKKLREGVTGVKVGLLCTATDPFDRPSMSDVASMLQGCRVQRFQSHLAQPSTKMHSTTPHEADMDGTRGFDVMGVSRGVKIGDFGNVEIPSSADPTLLEVEDLSFHSGPSGFGLVRLICTVDLQGEDDALKLVTARKRVMIHDDAGFRTVRKMILGFCDGMIHCHIILMPSSHLPRV
ncbi:LRR receptor-like serine/threonine-protein [Vigna angularis]|uniref:LRR receptor-like serine/threonine-protein n=1 Tax=Phaseolus angularis TaxID=3914 RepID=A0A8T0KG64_PHAAN|nr:LRR receptor-like serine/threonine-protein [Vigna angularis]